MYINKNLIPRKTSVFFNGGSDKNYKKIWHDKKDNIKIKNSRDTKKTLRIMFHINQLKNISKWKNIAYDY